jgi:hypothetical protein
MTRSSAAVLAGREAGERGEEESGRGARKPWKRRKPPVAGIEAFQKPALSSTAFDSDPSTNLKRSGFHKFLRIRRRVIFSRPAI